MVASATAFPRANEHVWDVAGSTARRLARRGSEGRTRLTCGDDVLARPESVEVRSCASWTSLGVCGLASAGGLLDEGGHERDEGGVRKSQDMLVRC
jgi:hypothetical protein